MESVFKKYSDDPRSYEYSIYDKKSGKLIGVGQIFLKKKGVGGLYVSREIRHRQSETGWNIRI